MFKIIYTFTPNHKTLIIKIFVNKVFIGGQSMDFNPEHYSIVKFYLENLGILISNIINIETEVKDME